MYTIKKGHLDNLLTFKSQNNKFIAEAEAINAYTLQACIDEFFNNGNPFYYDLFFTDKFAYQFVEVEKGKTISGIENITIKTKQLKISDVFAINPSKKSTKHKLDEGLAKVLDCMCGNLAKGYSTDRDNIQSVKIYAKFDISLECFVCNTANSINNLEKQLNRVFEILFGDKAPKARKSDVRILIDAMTNAKIKKDKSGYITGGELALLDKIGTLAYECANNRVYNHTLKSASGKAPKTNK